MDKQKLNSLKESFSWALAIAVGIFLGKLIEYYLN